MIAWTAAKTLLSMTVGSQCRSGAFSAGWAVARALGGTHDAIVEADQVRDAGTSQAGRCGRRENAVSQGI
jgi:hypothetical protein